MKSNFRHLKWLFIAALAIFCNANRIEAQNLKGRIVLISKTSTHLRVQVQLQAGSSNEQLSEANLLVDFSHGGTDLSFAGSPVKNTDYVWASGFDPSSSHYAAASTNVTKSSATELSINMDDGANGSDPVLSTSGWTPLVDLIFTVSNSSGSTNITFNTSGMETGSNGAAPAMDNEFDQNFNYFTDNGFSSGSLSVSTLPVTLTNFSAMMEQNAAQIKWTTVTEINNAYFTVQRSQDGKNFVDVFTREGAGNSNKTINYVAYDVQPLPGTSYYRLKQTDFNGASETFYMVSVYNPNLGTFAIESVSPTTFFDNTNLYYQMPADGNVQMVVTDMQGKIVENMIIPSLTGDNTYNLANTGSWRQGIYFVNMIFDGRESHIKMVKN